MRTQSAANILLDHMDGWQKVYTDDIATIHVRRPGAVHTRRAGGEREVKLPRVPAFARALQKCRFDRW